VGKKEPGIGVWPALIAVGICGALFLFAYLREQAAAEPISADEYLARAMSDAHRETADAELELARAEMVAPDGKIQMTLGGFLMAQFRSPANDPAPAAPAMLGAPVPRGGACASWRAPACAG
jgi:hypothetical protein